MHQRTPYVHSSLGQKYVHPDSRLLLRTSLHGNPTRTAHTRDPRNMLSSCSACAGDYALVRDGGARPKQVGRRRVFLDPVAFISTNDRLCMLDTPSTQDGLVRGGCWTLETDPYALACSRPDV